MGKGSEGSASKVVDALGNTSSKARNSAAGWFAQLAGKPVGQFFTVGSVAPHGSLQARRLSNGTVKFYWRYTYQGEGRREEIGIYDARLPPKQCEPSPGGGWTAAAAAAHAASLAKLHYAWLDRGGYRGYVASQELERVAQSAKQANEALASLESLMVSYWEHLQVEGKVSWQEVRNGLLKNVINAQPELSAQPAKSVTKDDIMKVLRGMGDPGPQRQKKKVRSWLHRAFALAVAANNDAALSETWGRFDIKHNPVTETTLSIPNGVDKDALLDDELRTYWHAIEDVPGIVGIALRLHLILGAPRLAQLLRLQRADIRPDLITLWDIKGRSGTRRPHVLPLDAQANAYVAKLCQEGRYAFSIDGGNSHISYFDLREAALDAVGNKIPRFKLKRLRSGIETLLAKLQVSQDVRGRVQSHGLSGVQNRHYNDYDYFPQKAKALRLLTRAIVGTPSRQTSSVPASTGVQRPAAAHGRRLRPRTARRSLRQRQRLAKPQSRTKVVEVAGKAGGTAPRGNGSGGQGA